MSANVGSIDRIFRAFMGLLLILAPLTNKPPIWESATLAIVSMALGTILIATALFRFCPLYRVLGISTCKL